MKMAEENGIEVINRPSYLCSKDALSEDVFVHGYNVIQERNPTETIDIVAILMCNAFAVTSYTILGDEGKSFTLFIDDQNQTLHHISHNTYLKDTTISGTVFMPDPITSSGESYAGEFVDNNDQTNTSLDNQLVNITLKGSFDNGLFLLENNHLKIVNHSSPEIQPTEKSDSIFEFNRSETGFEEVHALYHISRFADYIKDTLGFSNIVNYQIAVDVYALNGNDNSEFIGTTSPPRLNFGQGGIDDAEDSDILIHEYGHAVSQSAAPNTLIGYERLAMDEGFGDYWAAAYSSDINENDYLNIFNWDGHNEFWAGRSLDHSRKYSDGLDTNKYVDGELFGAMLIDIRRHLNDTTADKIILQSTYSWFPNMTFPEAYQQILKADSILYNANNSSMLIWLGCKRGFLTQNCELKNTIVSQEVQVDYSLLRQKTLRLIDLQKEELIEIFSTEGKLVYKGFIKDNSISLSNLSDGIYFLKIDNQSLKITF